MFSAGVSSPSENRLVAQHHLRRQPLERGDVLRRRGGVLRIAGHAIQPLEHAPARGQRRIDVHAAQERVDRPRRIAQGDIAMAALLVQAAEARVQLLETLQRRERLGNSLKYRWLSASK